MRDSEKDLGSEPTSEETLPDGRREPRWTPNHSGLRELDDRMREAMWDREMDRKRAKKK